MEALEEVQERLAILEFTARYADIADQKDWEALTALFTPTAVFEAEGVYGRTYRGAAEILKFYQEAPVATGHHPTGVNTTFGSEGQARTRLKMLVLFGRALFTCLYDLVLVKFEGDWKIERLQLSVVGRTDIPRPAAAPKASPSPPA
jgi:hypothetical protein